MIDHDGDGAYLLAMILVDPSPPWFPISAEDEVALGDIVTPTLVAESMPFVSVSPTFMSTVERSPRPISSLARLSSARSSDADEVLSGAYGAVVAGE